MRLSDACIIESCAVFHLYNVCHTCAVYVADVFEKWIITVRG